MGTPREILRGERGMRVSSVYLPDGRLGIVERDGTVLITKQPVVDLSLTELESFHQTQLFNSVSVYVGRLKKEIADRGLEGIGLYAGNGMYYVVPPPDIPQKSDVRPYQFIDLMLYEKGTLRRAFSTDGLAKDVVNISAIRHAIADPALQFRMYSLPALPPNGSPDSGVTL